MNEAAVRFLVFYGLIGFVFALYTMRIADAKGYGTGGWFFGGLFFNFIALIAICGMPLKRDSTEGQKKAEPQKAS